MVDVKNQISSTDKANKLPEINIHVWETCNNMIVIDVKNQNSKALIATYHYIE